jgi:RNA polymerase sigma-70 factor (ECF subfamily)
MENEERTLIESAQAGDMRAFDRLVRRYDRQVMQLAASLLNNRQDAEDVFQDVFVRVYKSLPRFRFESQFSTWLYRVVVNQCINYRRSRGRQPRSNYQPANSEEDWLLSVPDDGLDPESRVLNSEIEWQIQEALRSLPAKQRAVFVLRHYHGHKLGEIAEILHCAEGTVKNYLFRATRRLQKQLRPFKEMV